MPTGQRLNQINYATDVPIKLNLYCRFDLCAALFHLSFVKQHQQ